MELARSQGRPRRYVPGPVLVPLRALFRYSRWRDAYVLRLVGHRFGPVLRRERRSSRSGLGWSGPERRGRPPGATA